MVLMGPFHSASDKQDEQQLLATYTHRAGRATQGVIRNRVNQQGLWAAGFVIREWGAPWFLQEEVIGSCE